MNDALDRVMHSELFDMTRWSNEACEKFEWPAGRRPSIHSGPMASSDEVVSSKQWRNIMIDGQGGEKKLLGVEMEAGGVCAAADRLRVPYCTPRVISDNADPSKADDRWRPLGMKTLANLIEQLPLGEVLKLV